MIIYVSERIEQERFFLVCYIGIMETLHTNAVMLEDINALVFRPETENIFLDKSINDNIVELYEQGASIENWKSQLPAWYFNKKCFDLETKALDLLTRRRVYPSESQKWLWNNTNLVVADNEFIELYVKVPSEQERFLLIIFVGAMNALVRKAMSIETACELLFSNPTVKELENMRVSSAVMELYKEASQTLSCGKADQLVSLNKCAFVLLKKIGRREDWRELWFWDMYMEDRRLRYLKETGVLTDAEFVQRINQMGFTE